MRILGGIMPKKCRKWAENSGLGPPYYHVFAGYFWFIGLIMLWLWRKLGEKCVCALFFRLLLLTL